ncbi:GNAT family N-acetyltransferase [Mucilaginibacter rigui]|uniref:GNAT family N-acetyltransferase n=2 Tax=Mucilaginibacter rigui TaxID=534635 RepID=A0ABR7X2V4_9SPHI|nr:GNAT family N-acetyltransferase [Mucilaginibacter rigui]
MDTITIRPATLADMDTLLQFEQGVIAAERPFDPTLKDEHINYYNLPELITAAHCHLVVAELAGELIGSGYARIETSKIYLKHPQYAYLGFMYVLPQYRGKGVNKAVIAALQEWAVSQGMNELRLEVYYQNAPAVKAYEKVGFISHMIAMRKGV